jgi:halimadienyl-diphosphate synthase
MGPRGWGADSTFGIPDGDTTAVTCRLLRSAGYDVDHRILKNYEDQDLHIIRTYDYERNASVSTNVHALEALQLLPDYPNRDLVREQIILMLLDQRDFNIYWKDKWHASPYYATSHVLIGLLREESYIAYTLKHTIEWLLHTQRDDGSWGFFGRGTAEETAYVLTALLHYHCHVPVDLSVLRRAHIYLARAYEMQDRYPALWIEKCLYVPYDIVKSAILGALILYERTVGSE